MNIEYLIGERQTHRTTDMINDAIERIGPSSRPENNVLFVVQTYDQARFLIQELEGRGIQMKTGGCFVTILSALIDYLAFAFDTCYIDNADYLREPLHKVLQALEPSCRRAVICFEGKLFQPTVSA